MSYNTQQKRDVLNTLKNSDKALTAAEVAEALPSVGLSSVYRILSSLEKEGLVAVSVKERKRCYSFLGSCQRHLHATCRECGSLVHLDEEASRRIEEILEEEGLQLEEDALIPCICNTCRERKA